MNGATLRQVLCGERRVTHRFGMDAAIVLVEVGLWSVNQVNRISTA
jgi:hypothetical protein